MCSVVSFLAKCVLLTIIMSRFGVTQMEQWKSVDRSDGVKYNLHTLKQVWTTFIYLRWLSEQILVLQMWTMETINNGTFGHG